MFKKKKIVFLSYFTLTYCNAGTKDGNLFCLLHEYTSCFVYKITKCVTLLEANTGHLTNVIISNTLQQY